MSRTQRAVLILTVALLCLGPASGAASASHGKPFVARKGTVSIKFLPAVAAKLAQLNVEFNAGTGSSGAPLASTAYPTLSIEPASSQPSRAPRTPLNTAKPAGIVYIGPADVEFFQQLPTAATYGGIDFPEVVLGAHPALQGVLRYSHTGSEEVSIQGFTKLFLLNTSHVKPVLKGRTLTLKAIPMSLAPASLPLFTLLGTGFTAGQTVGSLTITAVS
jgi:hypothetical protein